MTDIKNQPDLKKFLFVTLTIIGLVIVIANFVGKETATSVSLLTYVVVTSTLVILSIILVKRYGIKGSHAKAWIVFLVFAVLWFAAERIIQYYNLVLGEEPFPSLADVFWLAGYPFLFVFMILYLKPMKSSINKKMIFSAIAISSILLAFSIYLVDVDSAEAPLTELVIGLAYPISDAIVLVPAIIGVTLFLGGRVNFLWVLMCLAIIFEAIADTGFLIATIDDTYYEGHPVDILFNWYYAIFSFGVYHHIKLFKDHRKDPYKNVEELK